MILYINISLAKLSIKSSKSSRYALCYMKYVIYLQIVLIYDSKLQERIFNAKWWLFNTWCVLLYFVSRDCEAASNLSTHFFNAFSHLSILFMFNSNSRKVASAILADLFLMTAFVHAIYYPFYLYFYHFMDSWHSVII